MSLSAENQAELNRWARRERGRETASGVSMVKTPDRAAEVWSGAQRMANRGRPDDGVVEREKPDTRLRRWEFAVACWVTVREVIPETPAPRPSTIPCNDLSGTWWEIRDDGTEGGSGQTMWWVEAATWQGALAEKRRLCLHYGWKPSWARIWPVLGGLAEGSGRPVGAGAVFCAPRVRAGVELRL